MGRPVNKRYFGSGSGNQIKVRAKIGSNAEGNGYIVSQRSTNRFRVNVNGTEGICKIVNKDSGQLAANEMIVNVLNDAGQWVQATKLFNRVAIVEGNLKVKWTFTTSNSDNAVEVPDVEENAFTLTISIDTDPDNVTVVDGDPAEFTVTASGVNDLTYQWQVSTDVGNTWSDVVGATSDTLIVESTDPEYLDGNEFRVIVSSASAAAEPQTSALGRLTIS